MKPVSLSELPPELAPSVSAEAEAMARREELVTILDSYRVEAEQARDTGDNPRTLVWRDNVDLYWNRFDFSKKAPWQAREVMPEVPGFVDRFAAAMKQALMASDMFYTIKFPGDEEGDLSRALKRIMDVLLSKCGRTPHGHTMGFAGVFEELMKLGALMNVGGTVLWKEDIKGAGYVAVEPVDPRMIWIDHKGRGLYRIRRYEIDRHELMRLARQEDAKGKPIYNLDSIESLASSLSAEQEVDRQRLAGTGATVGEPSYRKPITVDEYLCTILDKEGKEIAKNALVCVANERHIIRGPEKNPFWHKRDWVLSSPLVLVPLAPYGRSYVENFSQLARTFNELTNLILDATQTSAIKAFAASPDMLEDATQLEDGIAPNVLFRLDGSAPAKDFMASIDLGQLPADVVTVWRMLKDALREGAAFSELSLGQLAPKGRTSASEIVTAETNSSEYIRSIASVIEERVLEPILDLVWMTYLQHMPAKDPVMENVAGAEMYAALYARRKDFVTSPVTFQARGISGMIIKAQKLRSLMQFIGIVAQNEMLLMKFIEKVDLGKFLDMLMDLNDIDLDKLKLSPREQMMAQIAAQTGAGPVPGGAAAGQRAGPTGASAPGRVGASMGGA